MAEHTPGPWYHSPRTMWACATTKPGGFGDIVCTCHNVYECSDNEVRANARLIAAAPDLLSACRSAVQWLLFTGDTNPELTDRLQRAITKAEVE